MAQPSVDVQILHTGYVRRSTSEVGVTVPLVRTGDCIILADPGMAADPGQILCPLLAHGIRPEQVTHVFLTHHHPDHITHVGLFPHATLVDYRATHRGNKLIVHCGDGYEIAPGVRIVHTPGHSEEDASLLISTAEGTIAYTHCWWWEEFPDIDPRGWNQDTLRRSREKLLRLTDTIIPCHGPAYPVRIKPCLATDFDDIYQIINDAARAYRGVIPADRWHEPYMPHDELRQQMDQGIEFWGYRQDGQLLGVMGIQHVQDVTLIRHAYVRTAHRQHGIGGRLLRQLCGLTSRPVLIGTWTAASWAVSFYQKHGFKLVNESVKPGLLRKYWGVPERQIETSVVLSDGRLNLPSV